MSHGFEEDEVQLYNLFEKVYNHGVDVGKNGSSDNTFTGLREDLKIICQRIWQEMKKLRENSEGSEPYSPSVHLKNIAPLEWLESKEGKDFIDKLREFENQAVSQP